MVEVTADGPDENELAGLQPLLAIASRTEPLADGELITRIEQVLTAAVQVLGVDSVGLMLLDDQDRARRVGTTDEVSALLETGQIESGEGPGIDSLRTGETVATEDLSEPGRYPQLWRRLAGSGVRAVLSSPIRLDHAVIGNLNATLGRRHNWTAAQRRANQAYADVIGLALRASAQALDAGSRLLRLRRMGLVPEESPLWPVDPAGPGGPSPVGQPTTTTAEDE